MTDNTSYYNILNDLHIPLGGSQLQPEFSELSMSTSASEDSRSIHSSLQSSPITFIPRRSISSNFHLSERDFPLVDYEYQGVNIGHAFHEYQLESALTVNQLHIKADKKNFPKFL